MKATGVRSVARQRSAQDRKLRVLVVDDHDVVHWGFRVLLISGAGRMSPAAARAAGASGFVSKDWDANDIAMAVRMVGLGMTMFPPKADQPEPLLTEREREVLDLIAAGSTNREIAAKLYLSPHTVKEHTSALYRKLSARNRAEAVLRAQRIGLLG